MSPLRKKADLILLHAPSIYDFRKRPNLLGPISDVIPSTPIFEMYPIGFSSITNHLRQYKISVRIVNLAYRMLENQNFDVEKFITKLKPRAFGIDLHWLPHAHGSIEIAKICKKFHPDIPVMFGGYSATYFHEELIQYPEVDFVLRGDTTEDSVRLLMQQIIEGRQAYHSVPGLTWEKPDGQIEINPNVSPSKTLTPNVNSYKNLFKMAVNYFDLKSLTAIRDWWEYPITVVMTCRGCTQNCVICGGAQKAVAGYVGRKQISFRAPELVADDIGEIGRFSRAPIFVVGDLHQGGYDYAEKLFRQLKKHQIKNEIVLELFNPAKVKFFDWLADSIANFNFELSPESHDPEVRRVSGKHYSNEALEENIHWALERGCKKFDLFFMIGLSQQTYDSVMETVDYCEALIRKFGKRVVPFISPLAPFLDPGSIAFENAAEFGYKIFFHTLEEYRQALTQPAWKYVLGYETTWMDRETIVQASYEAGLRLTKVKARYGLINQAECDLTLDNIRLALERHQQIEKIYSSSESDTIKLADLNQLTFNMDQDSISTICNKRELRWPKPRRVFKYASIVKTILFE